MEYNKYKFYKLALVIIIAIIIGSFVSAGNYIISIIVIFVSLILMFLLKSKVNKVLTDERIDKIAGRAARITFIISVYFMAIAGLILISLRTKYPEFLITGYALSYITCGMLILYAIIFRYYNLK